MEFFLNATVAGAAITRLICEDYLEWFREEDGVILTVFTTDTSLSKSLVEISRLKTDYSTLPIHIVHKSVDFSDLYQYYGKRYLLNEWIPYRKGDIFRIYRLVQPLRNRSSYENQAVSIQFDIRYDRTAPASFRVYRPEHLSAVMSAIDFYHPERIVDFGCGCGANYSFLERALEKQGIFYQGVDSSRFLIGKAKDLFEKKDVRFTCADIRKLPYSENFFDIGFSESVLPLVSRPLDAIEEMLRITRKGLFAGLYTVSGHPKEIAYSPKDQGYPLNTGATWKYYSGVSDQVFFLPRTEDIKRLAARYQDKVHLFENNTQQFFRPLGIKTTNLFFFPAEWYASNRTTFNQWNFRPLM
jgi:ubiquinone/menaquinone biosynthesis C-methylase UbiE